MNTTDKINDNLTKEQKKQQRVRQVRRQKILLVGTGFTLLLGLILLGFFLLRPNPSELLTINEACEGYRSQVEQEATAHGMSDYVDLILALMMQESSGIGPDVMQSSEGAYNKRYPQKPNGITDTAYSISCGIQELKYSMEKAEVKSPTDMERIRLALQGYNFGADVYFSYMEKHNENVWSQESAEAFAQMASENTLREDSDPLKENAGPWAYGDQRYPEHVLRYYHPKG
jgi:hypothetical protein